MRNGTKETAPLSTSPAPYFRGEIVIVNAPKHEAHGYRVRIVKRTPRTVGEPGDVYKVRLASPVSDDANPRPIPRGLYFFDTEELKPAGCEECNYRGWIEMYDVADATDEDDRKRIERDDNCGVFASDDEAIAAAIKDGYTPQGCLGCFSPRCIACGYCHTCDDDDLRPVCYYGEAVDDEEPETCAICGLAVLCKCYDDDGAEVAL